MLKRKSKRTKMGKATKILNVRYKSCCGCGCDTLLMQKRVPIDSRIPEGKIFTEFNEETDKIFWDIEWPANQKRVPDVY